MRLIACLTVVTTLLTQVPQTVAAPILGATGAVVFGSTVPAYGAGIVSYVVTQSQGMSQNSIEFITGIGGASSTPLTFAIVNNLGNLPITEYSVGLSAPGSAGNVIGASITGVTLGATTLGQGFSFAFSGNSARVFGGIAPGGALPSDFVVTFAIPASGSILAPGFGLQMTTNPEPASLCLMGLGMAVAGGGSFWRKRRNKGLATRQEETPAI